MAGRVNDNAQTHTGGRHRGCARAMTCSGRCKRLRHSFFC